MNFINGLKAYKTAVILLFSRKFRWFLLFPFIVLILIFWSGNTLTVYIGNICYNSIEPALIEWIGYTSWLRWINTAVEVLIKIMIRITYFFLFFTFGGYLILIIMSPVYSWLSECTGEHFSGERRKDGLWRILKNILRGILIAVRNMMLQTLCVILLFICSFIPFVGFFTPLAMFLISAYFYGFSFLDYAMEQKNYDVKKRIRSVNKNIELALAVGSVFTLSLLIPGFSLIACSFISLLSVMAATIIVYKTDIQ